MLNFDVKAVVERGTKVWIESIQKDPGQFLLDLNSPRKPVFLQTLLNNFLNDLNEAYRSEYVKQSYKLINQYCNMDLIKDDYNREFEQLPYSSLLTAHPFEEPLYSLSYEEKCIEYFNKNTFVNLFNERKNYLTTDQFNKYQIEYNELKQTLDNQRHQLKKAIKELATPTYLLEQLAQSTAFTAELIQKWTDQSREKKQVSSELIQLQNKMSEQLKELDTQTIQLDRTINNAAIFVDGPAGAVQQNDRLLSQFQDASYARITRSSVQQSSDYRNDSAIIQWRQEQARVREQMAKKERAIQQMNDDKFQSEYKKLNYKMPGIAFNGIGGLLLLTGITLFMLMAFTSLITVSFIFSLIPIMLAVPPLVFGFLSTRDDRKQLDYRKEASIKIDIQNDMDIIAWKNKIIALEEQIETQCNTIRTRLISKDPQLIRDINAMDHDWEQLRNHFCDQREQMLIELSNMQQKINQLGKEILEKKEQLNQLNHDLNSLWEQLTGEKDTYQEKEEAFTRTHPKIGLFGIGR